MSVFIIAEVGINHNGDMDIAKKLILAAKYAGANAVKFQKRTIDRVYTKAELDKPRESPWGKTNRMQKEGLEFSLEQYDEIDRFCKEVSIEWFISPWDVESYHTMKKRFDPPYWKVASAMLGHEDLVHYIASAGKRTFISTGMSTMEEIQKVVNIFDKWRCPFELMHCNSQYPVPEDQINLKCMDTLRTFFNCNVGYSCHSTGIIFPALAVVLGATSIEKHLTLDRAMYGSDQAASVEPDGFKRMVMYVRDAEECLGDGEKLLTAEEEKCRAKLRRTNDI